MNNPFLEALGALDSNAVNELNAKSRNKLIATNAVKFLGQIFTIDQCNHSDMHSQFSLRPFYNNIFNANISYTEKGCYFLTKVFLNDKPFLGTSLLELAKIYGKGNDFVIYREVEFSIPIDLNDKKSLAYITMIMKGQLRYNVK